MKVEKCSVKKEIQKKTSSDKIYSHVSVMAFSKREYTCIGLSICQYVCLSV